MVENRDKHKEPVIRAFVSLPVETLVEVTERCLPGSGLFVPDSRLVANPSNMESFKMDKEETLLNSFKKKPILTTALVVFIIWIISLPYRDNSNANPTTQQPAVVETTPATEPEMSTGVTDVPEVETIDYTMVYTDSDARFDGGVKYYILIDPVDISDDSFKADIDNLVRKIVSEKGRKISLDIFDNRSALNVMYKQYGDLSLGRARSETENALVERHLVATLDSGLSTMPDSISFFPGTFKSHPEVGVYVENIEF